MKLFILTFTLLTLISCGKNNETGKSAPASSTDAYTAEEEENIRRSFINKGSELIYQYDHEMKLMLSQRTVGLIRNKLTSGRVLLSDRPIYDEHRRISRAVHHDNFVTLYIGHEEPNLSWGRFREWRPELYSRLVMHELLQMGNVEDRNFGTTDRILSRR